MSYLKRRIKGDNIIISIFSLMLITSPFAVMSNHLAYSQASQGNSDKNNANSLDMQNVPAKKVHVGDIDIAYKVLGKGDPILLLNGASAGMDKWDPSFLRSLSSNHTVIVFDSRELNTTTGSKPFTMQQLANDTDGLLDALKIQKANVLGYSLGSNIAEQLAITHPEKVDRLILVGSTCSGKEGIPKPLQFKKFQSETVNKALNNLSITRDEMKSLASASLGSGWIRLHPETLKNTPEAQNFFASIPPNTMKQQASIGFAWEATNWNGACDELAKLAKPTLVITGTDDNLYVPHENSLIIAGKIPGAWLVQIKDAGHAVMDQYPDKINKVLQTFLFTTTP